MHPHVTDRPHPPAPTLLLRAVVALRERIDGVALVPGDAGYDSARAAWNPRVDQHPAVIVRPHHVDDVVEAVRFATVEGLTVAVQATGHGVAAPADGALLLVTDHLTGVVVDPVTRTATVGAGARWRDVLRTAAPHGLTALAGSSHDVGAVGYTLGGGLGWLARRYGVASDGVLAFALVTPDGLAVRTSADRHPEVFWALKGGGAGVLGVVTEMEIELHAIGAVYAGALVYPAALAGEVMRRWRAWVADVRPELTSEVVVERDAVVVRGCWCGDVDAGAALVDAWRQWRRPTDDTWEPRSPSALEVLAASSDGVIHEGVTNEWVAVVRDEVVEALIESVTAAPQPVAWASVRHVGGAVRARSEAAVNDRGRGDAFAVVLCGGIPQARADARARLAPYVTGATFLNLVDGEERRERTASSFTPGHLARLRAVKVALDPSDRFRHGLRVGAPD